jgi:hypothetical protein
MTNRHSTISCLQTSVLRRLSSVVRPPADCPSCPFYQLACKAKNFFYQTNPNLLDRGRLTNPVGPKAYEGNAAFSLSRKRTQTVFKDHKSCWCKGLRRQRCIFAIKKTNPNEPKPVRQKNFFYETNPSLLGDQRSQTLLLQRFTKPRLHFHYQENEPKRTQLPANPPPIPRPVKKKASLGIRSTIDRPQKFAPPPLCRYALQDGPLASLIRRR